MTLTFHTDSQSDIRDRTTNSSSFFAGLRSRRKTPATGNTGFFGRKTGRRHTTTLAAIAQAPITQAPITQASITQNPITQARAAQHAARPGVGGWTDLFLSRFKRTTSDRAHRSKTNDVGAVQALRQTNTIGRSDTQSGARIPVAQHHGYVTDAPGKVRTATTRGIGRRRKTAAVVGPRAVTNTHADATITATPKHQLATQHLTRAKQIVADAAVQTAAAAEKHAAAQAKLSATEYDLARMIEDLAPYMTMPLAKPTGLAFVADETSANGAGSDTANSDATTAPTPPLPGTVVLPKAKDRVVAA